MDHNYEYDVVLYNGRFGPTHIGHVDTVKQALKKGKFVLICFGSDCSAPSTRNPWGCEVRQRMMSLALEDEVLNGNLTDDDVSRITYDSLPDLPYDDESWCRAVRFMVNVRNYPDASRVAIIGYHKDTTSEYLNFFPEWDNIFVDPFLIDGELINATDIRAHLFANTPMPLFDRVLSPNVRAFLSQYHTNSESGKALHERMVLEFAHDAGYKALWANSPYPVFTVAADAVVISNGHVLLVKRGKVPGFGLLACPGGHVEPHETLMEAALRELKEETQIDVPLDVLRSSILGTKLFDHPSRSTRGRVISQAVYIVLDDQQIPELPEIQAADDAMEAMWLPLRKVRYKREMFFEDHFSILLASGQV